MLRLLSVLALLLAPAGIGLGLGPADHPEEHHAPPTFAHERRVDVSALPLPNGFVLVPLRASAQTPFELEVELGNVTARDGVWGDALFFGNASAGWSAGFGASTASGTAEATAAGRTARCCQVPALSVPWAMWSGGGSSVSGELPAGEHVLALLVANVERYEVEVTLRTGLDVVTVGDPIVGTTVEAVDLVAEARRSVTQASVGGLRVAVAGGAAERAWGAGAGSTFVGLGATAMGDASADLVADLPGVGERVARLEDAYAHAFVLAPGAARVAIKNLDEAPASPLLQPGSYVSVTVLRAVLPLEAHVHHWDDGPLQ